MKTIFKFLIVFRVTTKIKRNNIIEKVISKLNYENVKLKNKCNCV